MCWGNSDLIQPNLQTERLLGRRPTVLAAYGGLFALLVAVAMGEWGSVQPNLKGDHVSAAQVAAMTASFEHAHGALIPVSLAAQERADALMKSWRIGRARAEALLAAVDNGKLALGWITLWDNFDEDGDIASLSTVGLTVPIPLWHLPTRLLIPYVPGRSIFITGERDGMGGGVTAAVELTSGALPLPPLAVGQTLALPLQ